MKHRFSFLLAAWVCVPLTLSSCGGSDAGLPEAVEPAAPPAVEGEDEGEDEDHSHDEVSLGKAQVGDLEIECWQAHGEAEAGKELHLVVKLPYADNGSTQVRAWIGTEDRLASLVAKGEYAPSHDDYDIHAEVPTPMPTGAKWWIEIERPDGSKQLGSIGML